MKNRYYVLIFIVISILSGCGDKNSATLSKAEKASEPEIGVFLSEIGETVYSAEDYQRLSSAGYVATRGEINSGNTENNVSEPDPAVFSNESFPSNELILANSDDLSIDSGLMLSEQATSIYPDTAQQDEGSETGPAIDETLGYFVDRIQVDNELIPESEPAVNVTDNRLVSNIQPSESLVNDNISYDPNAKYNFDTYNIPENQITEDTYVLNIRSKKIHRPSCNDVPKIAPQNYATSSLSIAELISQEYSTCGHCFK